MLNLNRRMPNGTYGGVGGGALKCPAYPMEAGLHHDAAGHPDPQQRAPDAGRELNRPIAMRVQYLQLKASRLSL